MKPKVVILDFGLGNMHSVLNACLKSNVDAKISSEVRDVEKADGLIIPGVGAFPQAMRNLQTLGLVSPVQNFVNSGKPLLGICIGMQLLFTESAEFENTKGLELIPGKVVKIACNDSKLNKVRVPVIGWNEIQINIESPIYKNLVSERYFYFVHSYHAIPEEPSIISANTFYGDLKIASSIQKDNIYATQFHPEKSSHQGLKIYENWAKVL